MTVEIGMEVEDRYVVDASMGVPHLPQPTLGTPNMIGLIERTCMLSIAPHLEEGQTTVGTHVCVSHEGPALPGTEILIHGRLAKIDRRRLTFDVEVRVPAEDRRISQGTHERAVVDLARYDRG